MKIYLLPLILLVLLLVFQGVCAEELKLGPFDELSIKVRGIEELSFEPIVVREDGCINYPLIGDVNVSGLTIKELQEILEDRLSEYVLNPKVFITLIAVGGKMIYIFGEVKGPGYIKVPKDKGNIFHAITLAGGVNIEANLRKVQVIKRSGEIRIVNIKKMMKKRLESEAIELENGDIVYVPRKKIIINLEKIMQILSLVTMTIAVNEALK